MDKKDFISGLIEKMTLDEKIGQLNQEWTTNDRMEEPESLAAKGMLGSCILTDTPWAGNSAQEDLYIDRLNKIQKAAVEKKQNGYSGNQRTGCYTRVKNNIPDSSCTSCVMGL